MTVISITTKLHMWTQTRSQMPLLKPIQTDTRTMSPSLDQPLLLYIKRLKLLVID
jgi:hypothetical protein